MNSVDETLSTLVLRGYPLALQSQYVHEGVERLRTMLNREIDEAEALQAAGERTFVCEQAPPADTRPLPVDNKSEGDDVN